MPDQTPDAIAAQLAALGLAAQSDEDLAEVTHRINAIRQALLALDLPDLDSQEPPNAPLISESTSWT